MKKFFAIILSFFYLLMQEAMACPGCTGTDPRDQVTIKVVGVFILLIYIPMFLLYKMIYKHRHVSKSFTRQ